MGACVRTFNLLRMGWVWIFAVPASDDLHLYISLGQQSTGAVVQLKVFGCGLLSAAVKYQTSSDVSCLCYRQDKEVIMEKCALQNHLGLFNPL